MSSHSRSTLRLLHTPVETVAFPIITARSKVLCLGSCFAEVIGKRFEEALFANAVNPFGTLFHPFALFQALDPSQKLADDLYLNQETTWTHYHLPKTFYASSAEELNERYQQKKSALWDAMQENAVLLLTLGTSHLYTLEKSWVANCHGQPQNLFEKKLSTLSDMTKAWDKLFEKLPQNLSVIVTVSPVRHIKDGLTENSLSKSQLRILAQHIVASDPRRIHYFPAYEILQDELRDYRYYASDMIHPSELAIDIIWERFQAMHLHADAQKRLQSWEKIQARMSHRPHQPESAAAQLFQNTLERELRDYRESAPPRQSDLLQKA